MPLSGRAFAPAIVLSLLATLVVLVTSAAAQPARADAAQTAAVQAHLLWSRYDSADVDRQLDAAKRAGAGMVRVDLGWASLEQERKGSYSSWYLAKIDHVVEAAELRGVEVLFTVWETPCWASAAPETLKQGCKGAWWDRGVQRHPPTNASDYADALAFLVGRYGRRVAAWEIWNEPNHPHYFKAQDPVASYARLVKAAYPAAKAADPGATVIAGSLADADYEFTEALYEQGVKGHFDAFSVHPYSEDRSPLHPGIAGWEKKSFVGGVPRVRDTMLAHADDKPIWLTEFGWSDCTVRGEAALYRNCVDAEVQASYLKQGFAQMQAFRSYVPVGVWFNLEDTSDDAGDRLDNYGLLDHEGSEKPAFEAFHQSAAAIASGRPVPEPPADVTEPSAQSAPDSPPAGAASPSGVQDTAAAAQQPGTATALAGPGPARAVSPGTATTPRLVLRAARRQGRIRLSGALRAGRVVRVRVHRWSARGRKFVRHAGYSARIRVNRSGYFRYRMARRPLRSGRWKVVVSAARRPALRATAIVR